MTKVRTASRSTGGVAIRLMSRTPVSASCRVRGIGVAVSVSTWTSARSSFSRSLWATPKCCSSSTISRPRSLNSTLLASSACVPITMSSVPSFMACLVALRLLGADQARQPADADRQALEALDEGAMVLARQQRRRRDHRHLLARDRRDEGRAQRHLGLAEADIAADQPVHRLAGRQVVDARRRSPAAGRRSRRRGSGRRTRRTGAFRRAHRLAAADGALGGDLDQPVGHVGDALLQPRLARLPGRRRPAGRAAAPSSAAP